MSTDDWIYVKTLPVGSHVTWVTGLNKQFTGQIIEIFVDYDGQHRAVVRLDTPASQESEIIFNAMDNRTRNDWWQRSETFRTLRDANPLSVDIISYALPVDDASQYFKLAQTNTLYVWRAGYSQDSIATFDLGWEEDRLGGNYVLRMNGSYIVELPFKQNEVDVAIEAAERELASRGLTIFDRNGVAAGQVEYFKLAQLKERQFREVLMQQVDIWGRKHTARISIVSTGDKIKGRAVIFEGEPGELVLESLETVAGRDLDGWIDAAKRGCARRKFLLVSDTGRLGEHNMPAYFKLASEPLEKRELAQAKALYRTVFRPNYIKTSERSIKRAQPEENLGDLTPVEFRMPAYAIENVRASELRTGDIIAYPVAGEDRLNRQAWDWIKLKYVDNQQTVVYADITYDRTAYTDYLNGEFQRPRDMLRDWPELADDWQEYVAECRESGETEDLDEFLIGYAGNYTKPAEDMIGIKSTDNVFRQIRDAEAEELAGYFKLAERKERASPPD